MQKINAEGAENAETFLLKNQKVLCVLRELCVDEMFKIRGKSKRSTQSSCDGNVIHWNQKLMGARFPMSAASAPRGAAR